MWSSLTSAVDRPGSQEVLRAKIPADVNAPDRVAFDLTFRQICVLATAGVIALAVWGLLAAAVPMVPVGVRAVPVVPIAGAALALAVGRRDGLTLDAWLGAALMFRDRPRRLLPVPPVDPPDWAPMAVPPRPPAAGRRRRPADPAPSVLQLPVDAVDDAGVVHGCGRAAGSATVLVGATTVNVTLRTPTEQAGLVAGLGRWLNGLTTGVQIVVSTRRVDLPAHAVRLADRAHTAHAHRGGGNAGLVAAALDHAEFLLDLAERLDPLARTVTVAATATGGPSPATVARRTAEHTVAALSALGARAAVLDGPEVTAVLAAATDPYQSGDAGWTRTPPGHVVTGRPLYGDVPDDGDLP